MSSVFLRVKSQSVTFHTCLIRSELKLLQLHTLTHSIWSPVYNDIYYIIHFCKDLSPSRAHVTCLHSQTNQEDSPGTLSVPPHSLPVQFLLLVLRLFTPQKHSVIIRMHLGSFLSFLTATSTAHKRLHKMWCWFFKQTHYIPPPPFWNPRFKAEQKRCVLWVQSEPVVCLIWAEDAGSSLTKPPLNSNRYRTVASGARSSLWICCFCVSFMSWILSVWHESSGNCSSALSPIYQLKIINWLNDN